MLTRDLLGVLLQCQCPICLPNVRKSYSSVPPLDDLRVQHNTKLLVYGTCSVMRMCGSGRCTFLIPLPDCALHVQEQVGEGPGPCAGAEPAYAQHVLEDNANKAVHC